MRADGPPSGSDDADPFNVTAAADATLWAGPAFATGGTFTLLTTTFTEAALVAAPSDTVNWNVNVVDAVGQLIVGAVNVGPDVNDPLNVTDGPAVCVQL